jgi:putative ATPase
MKELGYNDGYKYPHDYHNHYVHQEYLPQELKNMTFYTVADNANEKRINDLHKSITNKGK